MIPFNKPYLVGNELLEMKKSLESCHLAGDGPFTRIASEWLESKLGAKKVLLTTSCTSALEMAVILSDIGFGDEVIVPSYTFVSSANAIVLRGATPVFVDIDRTTLSLDIDLVESAITEKTKAIMIVHYAGFSCDMDVLMRLALKNNLIVIEDAAQALLSKYKNKYLGTIGHFGCVSFHETKNITCGEGGALFINHEKFEERAEIIREKGTNRSKFFRGQIDKYTWCDLGSSYLMSDILAACLFVQLENSEVITKKRLDLWNIYFQNLNDILQFKVINEIDYNSHNAHMFYLKFHQLEDRSAMQKYLGKVGIASAFHYIPLHSSSAGRKFGRVGSNMNVTDNISDCLLRLPLWVGIDIEYVIDKIKYFYSK